MGKGITRFSITSFFVAYGCVFAINAANAASEIPVQEKSMVYEQACASCHMAYAPSILPERSWKKIMQGLDNHFGDDAELEPAIRQQVADYLQRNAAEQSTSVYAKSILNLLRADETPLRTSDTQYFKLKHDLVKPRMVTGNPKVKSYSRCEACHHAAHKGNFNRFEVRIPHYYRKAGRFVYFPPSSEIK